MLLFAAVGCANVRRRSIRSERRLGTHQYTVTEQVLEFSRVPLAAQLNAACQCIWGDRAKLRDQLRANLGDAASLLEARAGLVSGSVVFLAPGEPTPWTGPSG